jgi:SAM-dependent methyltransferase
MSSRSWGDFTREDYLRMIDRQWPFWASLNEFVISNGIKSAVEVGCGIGHLCFTVDSYTGIDLNQALLDGNEAFYRRGRWLCGDWLTTDGLEGDLFLASSVIAHCESFQVFLEKALSLPCRYFVVSFSKGLRDYERIQKHPTGEFFENYYCRADVEAFLYGLPGPGSWAIYDFPLSRRERQARMASVLVIDRTGECKLDMWEKRALYA